MSTANPTSDLVNTSTFSNWRVLYVAPNAPGQDFEPWACIEADDSDFNGRTIRVFDVPDPDAGQLAIAEFTCQLLNAATPVSASPGRRSDMFGNDLSKADSFGTLRA